MSIWQYFIPDSAVAGLVLLLLFILFFVWCWLFLGWARKLQRQREAIDRCSDVNLLSDFLKGGNQSGAGGQPSESEREREAGTIFQRYCEEKRLDPSSTVGMHIRAIFDAGWKNSRLDVGEITRHTIGELFKPHSLLRSVLAVFIIVGLLGTLIGLAASLGQLSPPTPNGTVQSATELSKGLGRLLTQLKSAFAPSIWGIFLTLVGVLLLSFYLHLRALPVRKQLERITLTIWVPQLFPSTSQQFLERLHRSEQHMQQSFEVVRRMAEFSSTIQEEVGRFRDNLQNANKPLSVLAKSSLQLNKFNDKFGESVGSLTSFQRELQGLYGQMVDDSTSFHDSVRDNIRESAEFQKNVQSELKVQSEYIRSLMVTMKSYEQAYVRERGQLDVHLQEVLSEAKKAYSAIVGMNRDLIKEIGSPLREDVKSSLEKIGKILQQDLQVIQEKFNDLDAPIAEAAKEMASTAKMMRDFADSSTKKLQQEGEAQAGVNQDQLNRLELANKQIALLLTELVTVNRSQSENTTKFSNTVADLAKNVVAMGENITALNQTEKFKEANAQGRNSGFQQDSQLPQSTKEQVKENGDSSGGTQVTAVKLELDDPSARDEGAAEYEEVGKGPSAEGAVEELLIIASPSEKEESYSTVNDNGGPELGSEHQAKEGQPEVKEDRPGLLGFFAKYK